MEARRLGLAPTAMGLGPVTALRGALHSLDRGLGWQGLLLPALVGLALFALGFFGYRHLTRRQPEIPHTPGV